MSETSTHDDFIMKALNPLRSPLASGAPRRFMRNWNSRQALVELEGGVLCGGVSSLDPGLAEPAWFAEAARWLILKAFEHDQREEVLMHPNAMLLQRLFTALKRH